MIVLKKAFPVKFYIINYIKNLFNNYEKVFDKQCLV